jgi:hypothetical protein
MEVCGRITTWPSVGVLFANEDTSFVYTASDGTQDSFQYQFYGFGVAIGSPVTVSLQVGTIAHSSTMVLAGGSASVAGVAARSSATFSGSLSDADVARIAQAVWQQHIENGLTAEQMLRIMFSALAGVVNGAGSGSIAFRDVADSKNRIAATTTPQGNRSAIILDGS